MAQEYIAGTVPAKTDRVSGTTLFHLAMLEFGDPLQWVPIAQLNELTDPWVTARTDVLIPPVLPGVLRDLPLIGGLPYATPPLPLLNIPVPLSLTLSGSAPVLSNFFNSLAGSLGLGTTIPVMVHGGSPNLSPATASLALGPTTPTLGFSYVIFPLGTLLTLTASAPSAPISAQPGVASLTLTPVAPTVVLSYAPAAASMALGLTTPSVALTNVTTLKPSAASLALSPQALQSPVLITWSGPTSGLIHRWSLDPTSLIGGAFADLVGSNNLTVGGTVGSTASGSGAFNSKAATFDGSTSVLTPASLPIPTASNPFSYGVWVKTNDISFDTGGDQPLFQFAFSGGVLVALNNAKSGKPGYIKIGNSGGVDFNGTGDSGIITSAQQLTSGNYAHVVFTWDGSSSFLVYVNGVLVGTAGSSIGLSGAANEIGQAASAGNWDGAMYQIAIYNRALSASDVSNLYAAG